MAGNLKKYSRERYQNDWLPPDEDANVNGYWVPTPEEIEQEKQRLRLLEMPTGIYCDGCGCLECKCADYERIDALFEDRD